MSGGFFRGTSAAQDTRFSNKQAKLMKSQKFPPELDHLVDIRKVKMDVMKPWIATRVTEFLGFEDEVLINFIYGLLDGKEVNGKEVQIQLTGFMEKNTGKFMKELWTLLLSAQQNSSGVPQQFLDAKEEETKKKKAETDRIADEIQRKKELEKKDLEPEKRRNLEDEADITEKDEPRSKHQTQESSGHFADEEFNKRNGSRGRSRSTRSRSVSKSVSNSRSYSGEKQRPRSTSKSPQPRGRSISSEKMRHSRLKRSVTPPRRHSLRRSRSPPVRISSNSRQRSSSRSRRRSRSPPYRRLRTPPRRRSRSPVRSRSPIRRRSRTPTRYRSRSPIRRRSPSPVHSRSASPVRRRSPPVRRRSPSPHRRRSPSTYKRRLPSPYRRKSPSPVQRRSISPPWRRSRSPVRRRSPLPPLRRRYHRSPSRSRSPFHNKSSVLGRRGSPSPPRRKSSSVEGASSQSPVRHMSKSPIRRKSPRYHRSPVQEREKTRANMKLSPKNHEGKDSARKVPITLRSPQRIEMDTDVSPRKAPAPLISPDGSPSRSGSTPPNRRTAIEDQSPDSIPVKAHLQRPETGVEDEEAKHAREYGHHKSNKHVERRPSYSIANNDHKKTLEKDDLKGESVIYPLANRRHTEAQIPSNGREGRKNREINDSAINQPKSPAVDKDRRRQEGKDADDTKGSWRNGSESNLKSIEKIDEKDSSMNTSGLQESDKRQPEFEGKRKYGKSTKEDSDSGDSFNSETGRKEAKRRRKEEKKQKKEERRKRKEDKRRRRDERGGGGGGGGEKKKKLVTTTNVKQQQPPSSDNEESRDTSGSDFERKAKRTSYESDGGLSESEQQKKLEIELRNKALESLKAKKKRSVH